jgi:hypothetical protein
MSMCGLNCDGGVQAGEQVSHRHTHLLRSATGQVIALAGHAHQATHALDGVVVACAVLVRPGLAEAGDGAVDQLGIEGVQTGEVQTIAGHVAYLVVLDEHIGFQGQLADQCLTLGRGDVAGDGAFVSIRAQVVGGFGGVGSVAPEQERWTPAAGVVATGVVGARRPLHLHHVGAQIGKGLGAPGAGEHARQVKYADTIQSVHIEIVRDAWLDACRPIISNPSGALSAGFFSPCRRCPVAVCAGLDRLQPHLQLARNAC